MQKALFEIGRTVHALTCNAADPAMIKRVIFNSPET